VALSEGADGKGAVAPAGRVDRELLEARKRVWVLYGST
jgi:hypothetical protein